MSEAQRTDLPAHQTILRRDGHWRLWRTVAFRAAGFPFSRVLDLASEVAASRAEELVDCIEALRAASRSEGATRSLQSIGRELADPSRWLCTLDRLAKAPPGDEGFATVSARAALAQAIEASEVAVSDRLRGAVRDERFCEALVWQNAAAWLWRTAVEQASFNAAKPHLLRQ